mmetsp:Transcript_13175/g.25915  ORF Transcript_13175/g.25915 Transcript_13175/m.25915 type:complete len:316 (+) Transcript_13175:1386-2333(+)
MHRRLLWGARTLIHRCCCCRGCLHRPLSFGDFQNVRPLSEKGFRGGDHTVTAKSPRDPSVLAVRRLLLGLLKRQRGEGSLALASVFHLPFSLVHPLLVGLRRVCLTCSFSFLRSGGSFFLFLPSHLSLHVFCFSLLHNLILIASFSCSVCCAKFLLPLGGLGCEFGGGSRRGRRRRGRVLLVPSGRRHLSPFFPGRPGPPSLSGNMPLSLLLRLDSTDFWIPSPPPPFSIPSTADFHSFFNARIWLRKYVRDFNQVVRHRLGSDFSLRELSSALGLRLSQFQVYLGFVGRIFALCSVPFICAWNNSLFSFSFSFS